MMKFRIPSALVMALILALALGACSVSHPNEKIIIGTWRPVKVEKIVDSSDVQSSPSGQAGVVKTKPGAPPATGEGAAGRKDAELDRLVRMEERASMEIYPDKTAIKNFPGKPLKATWKMKGKGTRIVAKNLENKQTFTIEILEINKEKVIVIEHTPVGDIRIEYERQFDAN